MTGYFKGWYFKAQNKSQSVALIPAMHRDENRKKSASIQIITEKGAWCVRFPYEQFKCRGNKPQATIGESRFGQWGLKLNIKTDDITAFGDLDFGQFSPLSYDIMGPFRYVPFMECRHSVWSMTHTVSGQLNINNERYVFDHDVGYVEGDRGRSFPKVYAWTQCNFFDRTAGSIMLSVAEIPLATRRFTGIIGVILWQGKPYRIATYLGAKAESIGDGTLVVTQGALKLTARLIKEQDKLLFAPVSGSMARMVRESLSCTAYYLLEENGRKLLEFTTDQASFEYEYSD